MFYYNQYVRAQSLDEAYELYQKKPNFVLGGMLWLKMKNKTLGTAIDLCDLGLDQIDEDENETARSSTRSPRHRALESAWT